MTRTDSRAAVASCDLLGGTRACRCLRRRPPGSIGHARPRMDDRCVMPALQGCGFVARAALLRSRVYDSRADADPGVRRRRRRDPCLDRGDARRVRVAGRAFHCRSRYPGGQTDPVRTTAADHPGFVINWIGDEPKEVLTLVSFRITPGGRRSSPTSTASRSRPRRRRRRSCPGSTWCSPRGPATVRRAGSHFRIGFARRVPPRGHGTGPGEFTHRRFRVARLVSVRRPGAAVARDRVGRARVIDGQEVAPFKAAFARHTGWMVGARRALNRPPWELFTRHGTLNYDLRTLIGEPCGFCVRRQAAAAVLEHRGQPPPSPSPGARSQQPSGHPEGWPPND